jgi:hypothetical protein
VPLETHIAEKLHAYTVPRERPNSRLKDLPDLALLSMVRRLRGAGLREAIGLTFNHRGTHLVPDRLPAPPVDWSERYPRFVRGTGLPWASLDDAFARAKSFLDPVLAGGVGDWSPETGTWSTD